MRFNQLLRKIVGGEDGNEERKGEEERRGEERAKACIKCRQDLRSCVGSKLIQRLRPTLLLERRQC